MNTSTIIKNLILPIVIKSAKVDVSSAPETYWNQFANDFISYEIDASPIYSTLFKLELQNPEDVFQKLPKAYSDFINELAEGYVFGNENELTRKLVESNNDTFLKQVSFLKTMKAVITKVERKALKKNLPLAYDRLTFELDPNTLEAVAKKKSREGLKAKFKQWDAEMVEREPVLMEANHSSKMHYEKLTENEVLASETKVISLSWKYAVAACLVLGIGVWFYDQQNQGGTPENTVVTAPEIKQPTTKTKVIPEVPTEALAEVSTVSKPFNVIENVGYGYASKTQKVDIIESNQKARILSIGKAIEKYQMHLEKEFATHKIANEPGEKELRETIASLKRELKQLKERENRYTFDGKTLKIYFSISPKINNIILFEGRYYLHKEKNIYRLFISNQPQRFQKETDSIVLTSLDTIIFENDN